MTCCPQQSSPASSSGDFAANLDLLTSVEASLCLTPTENGEEHIFPFCSHFLTYWKTFITSVSCASPGRTALVHRQKKVEGHCSALTNIKQSSHSLWMQLVKSFLFSGLSSDSQPLFPSCSLPSPSLGLSAAPFLLSGLVCFFCTSALFT